MTRYSQDTDAIWLSRALSVDISPPVESMLLSFPALGVYPVFVFWKRGQACLACLAEQWKCSQAGAS